MDGEVGCVAGMMFRTGEGESIRGYESNWVATGFWRGFFFFWRFLVVFDGGRVVLGREFCFFFFFGEEGDLGGNGRRGFDGWRYR